MGAVAGIVVLVVVIAVVGYLVVRGRQPAPPPHANKKVERGEGLGGA